MGTWSFRVSANLTTDDVLKAHFAQLICVQIYMSVVCCRCFLYSLDHGGIVDSKKLVDGPKPCVIADIRAYEPTD